MEEMHQAAEAYHANLSEDQRANFQSFFKRLDMDGDEKVSLHEYLTFLRQQGITCITNSSFFKELDKDGNGSLDYSEVVTLYYIYRSRRLVFCDGCGEFMKGLYFTCVKCFEEFGTKSTFDLCSSCYKNKSFSYEHEVFLDNYVLLLSKRTRLRLTSQANGNQDPLEAAIKAIGVGVDIGSNVCDLM